MGSDDFRLEPGVVRSGASKLGAHHDQIAATVTQIADHYTALRSTWTGRTADAIGDIWVAHHSQLTPFVTELRTLSEHLHKVVTTSVDDDDDSAAALARIR